MISPQYVLSSFPYFLTCACLSGFPCYFMTFLIHRVFYTFPAFLCISPSATLLCSLSLCLFSPPFRSLPSRVPLRHSDCISTVVLSCKFSMALVCTIKSLAKIDIIHCYLAFPLRSCKAVNPTRTFNWFIINIPPPTWSGVYFSLPTSLPLVYCRSVVCHYMRIIHSKGGLVPFSCPYPELCFWTFMASCGGMMWPHG